MKVWILTKEYNDYDQHGEYFVAAFATAPTHQQLVVLGVPGNRTKHVIDGGGRVDDEYSWFYLQHQDIGD